MTDAEHIHALQRALAFWLPNVPDDDCPRTDRIARDAYLLMGYDPSGEENEQSAEELGWIKVMTI